MIQELRTRCAPPRPVRVRVCRQPRTFFGITHLSQNGKHFTITVCARIREVTGAVRRVSRQEFLDTLIHEWAHTLSWDTAPTSHHGPAWGRAYARCYRAILDSES